MTARAWRGGAVPLRGLPALALVPALLLGGCSSPSAPGPAGTPCADADLALGAQCLRLEDVTLLLLGCVESALTLQPMREAFPVPAGYQNSPSAVSPQQLQFTADRCREAQVAGVVEGDVSLALAGISVDAPDRGQPTGPSSYTLEVVTSSPTLRALFGHAGFAVKAGEVGIVDQGAVREATVAGDVDYRASIQMDPLEGGLVRFNEVHHGARSWNNFESTCTWYQLFGEGQLRAGSGALAGAMLPGGAVAGIGSQAIACDVVVSFGPLG